MKKHQNSFKAINHGKINKLWRNNICAKMRAGKERKLLESPMPDRPPDIAENWFSIKVERSINGSIQTVEYFGDGINWNSYTVWNPTTHEQEGIMTLKRALGKAVRQFARIKE